MKYVFIALCLSILMPSCENNAKEQTTTDPATPAQFGEPINADGAISFEELVSLMQEAETADVKVRARVETVCQTKGCWMTVKSDDPSITETLFVQFEDYGFFMPKDLSGSEVAMTGQAYWEITSVEDQRHYAEDEGLSAEEIAAITEPLHELKFMATGVVVISQ